MKNLKAFLVAIGFALFSVFSLKAQNDKTIQASINHKKRDTVEVVVQKFDDDVVRVNIYGKTGVLIHRDVLRKNNNVRLTYDISGFPDGEFKITRGRWSTVEVNKNGEDIENRFYQFGKEETLKLKVENWKDLVN